MNDNRARSILWRAAVAEWLGEELEMQKFITPRPYLLKIKNLPDDFEQGMVWGLGSGGSGIDVLLNARTDLKWEVSNQVDRSRTEAELDNKTLYFSLQKRSKKVFADPADSLVFTDGHCLLEVLKRLRKLAAYEKAEAAAQAAERLEAS
ncbi:hypothetical protein E3T43_00940 [Cryobacterium sp. Hh7]|uniref:hypothetical protein n=1 Tax=Cryobacterium sp. Hh7 TaxID=1259159 RepID=UPI00106AF3C9|nr:hypothetical protein [Cryobacterium sp. Hh7]TFD61192.1 hypothetical protein E3T43_00940 [Cryobacterium sp. Hh7]